MGVIGRHGIREAVATKRKKENKHFIRIDKQLPKRGGEGPRGGKRGVGVELDVELSVPSPAPGLLTHLHASHRADNGLNL